MSQSFDYYIYICTLAHFNQTLPFGKIIKKKKKKVFEKTDDSKNDGLPETMANITVT